VNNGVEKRFSAFQGYRRVASGPLDQIAIVVKRIVDSGDKNAVTIYDDSTGRAVDIDVRGTEADLAERFASTHGAIDTINAAVPSAHGVGVVNDESPVLNQGRGRGRPKLGVIAREVTLLPRHWDWLNAQPGGASVVLRKLVEEARRNGTGVERARQATEAAYHFMSAIAGDLPGFEEAARALFANNESGFRRCIAQWPEDIRDHLRHLSTMNQPERPI